MKSGEFTSGVRDGMDDATHDALNKCMLHVDEAIEYAAKTKGESAEYEASEQERAEKVLVGSIRRAATRVYIINCRCSFSDGAVWCGFRFSDWYHTVQCSADLERREPYNTVQWGAH